MPRLIRILTAVLIALLVVHPVAHAAQPTVIGDGHVDLGPRLVDGRWTFQLRDDTGTEPVWRDLSDVVLQVADVAKTTIPEDPAYAFLGTPGGAIWVLPQVQSPGVVWPGWNTQDPSVAGVIGREVDWRLHGVDGPGRFELFLSGNFGAPEPIFSSDKPYPQETGVEAGTHVHGNWVFTVPGAYSLDLEMSTVDGRSDRSVLKVHIGPGDPATAFAEPTQATTSDDPARSDRSWQWIALGTVLLAGTVAGALFTARRRRAATKESDV